MQDLQSTGILYAVWWVYLHCRLHQETIFFFVDDVKGALPLFYTSMYMYTAPEHCMHIHLHPFHYPHSNQNHIHLENMHLQSYTLREHLLYIHTYQHIISTTSTSRVSSLITGGDGDMNNCSYALAFILLLGGWHGQKKEQFCLFTPLCCWCWWRC